ncbi:hypothetical protein [Swingsia samuiensis]|uniref:Uncharacterized protein n=1 Tax=Swingsia samuiensis TaxID=1293412 RepID=A0A4Y6UHW5_9PROT|nr:hypothetical protein [Swingsia samuiensis]QDH17163.1 hypothetical protein E3D00_05980 [Swingsia samuiensis]
MKPLELGQEVLSAQGTIVKRSATRIGRRIACALVAAVFLMFAAISFHGFMWAFFMSVMGLSCVKASLCVIAVDLFFVIIFGICAAWSIPDPVEIEAKIRRDRKLVELRQAFALSTMMTILFSPLGRTAGKKTFSLLFGMFKRSKKG